VGQLGLQPADQLTAWIVDRLERSHEAQEEHELSTA
jgi:hypothetical protein